MLLYYRFVKNGVRQADSKSGIYFALTLLPVLFFYHFPPTSVLNSSAHLYETPLSKPWQTDSIEEQ